MIKRVKSIFYNIDWKAALKDVAKFYIYLVVFYGLAFLLVWGQAYISLENYNTGIDKILSEPLTAETDIKDFDFKMHEIIATQMSHYMFVLVCFGVFFAIPPKKFKHVIIVTILISFTAANPFFYKTFADWFHSNFYLCAYILAAWLCSLAWVWFRRKLAGMVKRQS